LTIPTIYNSFGLSKYFQQKKNNYCDILTGIRQKYRIKRYFEYLHDYIEMHGQQNVKFTVYCDIHYIGNHIYKAVFMRACKEIQCY